VATHPLQLTFVQSASKTGQLPPTPCEVAFVGRTQLLNLFVLPTGATVMDLPGYGFAKVHASARNSWGPMIEGYITGRENLEMVVVLVDGLIGPTALDVQMLEWLRFSEVNHMIVATKQDKVKPSKIGARKAELAAGCNLEINDVLWVSAAKNVNIEVLRNRVLELLKYTPSEKKQPVRLPTSTPRATSPVARAPRVASAPADPRTHPAARGNPGEARTPGVTRTPGTPRPARAPQREKTQAHLDELNDFG
jgi:GTP-binding protein